MHQGQEKNFTPQINLDCPLAKINSYLKKKKYQTPPNSQIQQWAALPGHPRSGHAHLVRG